MNLNKRFKEEKIMKILRLQKQNKPKNDITYDIKK